MQAPEPTNKYGKTFAIIAWLILMVLLFMFFQDTIDKQLNPNQQLHSIQGSGGETRTVLIRNKSGHYVGTALINNQPVNFMLDTGATTIAIDDSTAKQLGMPFGQPMQVSTANGVTQAFLSRVDSLQLGDITLYNIPASIVLNLANGRGDAEILLGMSALKQLEFHQQGNQLTLIQHQ
ncbi:TIGR02281 family clan AA aspartic protease [Rheinheimera baltica]|uniref:retropepsin-like aspartic protease family protein n=1 Tax=Rheinheimera baltica TaxID=67576 RepID=UPI00273FE653|nr:TIGR02281 family clan AA aspartic protease [Rheinheimera baltica]MDP5142033.1 TIGR02281 family clan AA aspartic protease [Rheinheimera baltica]